MAGACRAVWIVFASLAFPIGMLSAETSAERLGFPAGSKVLILHADDIGLSWEANVAAERYFAAGQIRSASVMVPPPWFDDFASWVSANPGHDIGLHLTLNAEWQTYRWGAISPDWRVFTLIDRDRRLHRDLERTALLGFRREAEREIDAQIERARRRGLEPTHIDSHMGALFTRPDLFREYLETSVEIGIPAVTFTDVQTSADCIVRQEFPLMDVILERFAEIVLEELEDYPFPSADVICSVPRAESYAEKKARFFATVRRLPPGLTHLFFHPSVDSPGFRRITNSWQQRVWEAELFADPEVEQFFADEGIVQTDWVEVMARHRAASP